MPNSGILPLVFFNAIVHHYILNSYISGIEVLQFQPDGKATMESVAIYDGKLDRNINVTSVTLCARIKVFFFHGRDNFFHLYDNETYNRYMIRIEIWMNRARPVWANSWHFQLFPRKLETHRWYHICFTYNETSTEYQTFVDGNLIYTSYNYVPRVIYGSFAVLGQGDVPDQSFSGELTQVNVWQDVLPQEDISVIANCSLDIPGDYLSWNEGWILRNVTSYEIELGELCNGTKKARNFWFTNVLYHEANYICEALGTHLPFPTSVEECTQIFLTSREYFTSNTPCTYDFHASAVDIEVEGHWIRPWDRQVVTDIIPWIPGEPNGLMYENCIQAEWGGIYDADCISHRGCAMCSFDNYVIYSLIGAGELDMRYRYFLAYQDDRDHLVFMAYGEYKIELSNGTWKWSHVVTLKVIAEMIPPKNGYNYPMGRNQWRFYDTFNNLDPGEATLLLTPCSAKEYSCDDATCIPIEFRCDLKFDCNDGSDEFQCQIMLLPEGYRSDLSPVSDSNMELLPLHISVSVWGIAVETTDMTITMVYELSSTWYDSRINFVNLKDYVALNVIPHEKFSSIWIPTLTFPNSVDNAESINDERSTLQIRKTIDTHTMQPVGPGEAYLSPGSVNPMVIYRKYVTTFHCNFDLAYYPFDEQSCGIHFRISTASEDFVFFDANESTAIYTGDKMLTEYMVGSLDVYSLETSRKRSELRVIIPLKRRSGYAILNIYIPSTILLCITYVTLYFRPRIFDTRLMSSLTTLLVVATLFTQVSSYLPKTSYYKMVDIWLLFCIATIFLIIIFHTLIDASISFAFPEDKDANPFFRVPLTFKTYKKNSVFNVHDSDFQRSCFALKKIRMLIIMSRVIVLVLFIVFNAFYWGLVVL